MPFLFWFFVNDTFLFWSQFFVIFCFVFDSCLNVLFSSFLQFYSDITCSKILQFSSNCWKISHRIILKFLRIQLTPQLQQLHYTPVVHNTSQCNSYAFYYSIKQSKLYYIYPGIINDFIYSADCEFRFNLKLMPR